MRLQPTTVLHNRYRIESVLGRGGMGAVYRAFDMNLGVIVAVKENLFTTREHANQFREEAKILATLRHANLPRVTDHFVIEGQGQYLVMDHVEGEDLRQLLEREGRVDEATAMGWFLDVCDALAYLHSRNPPVVHRDIKPGNIKLTPDNRAILVDFGLAKLVDDDRSTNTGAKAMTPGFSPPEQYGTGRTDTRTDIYSLGATLYAALTAAVPEDALERAMGRARLTPVRSINPAVSPAVAKATERALEIRADDRFQTVGEFGTGLKLAARADHPTVVHNYPHLDRTRAAPQKTVLADAAVRRSLRLDRARRWPKLAAGAAVGLFVLAGVGFGVASLAGYLSRMNQGVPQTAPVLFPSTPPGSAEPGGTQAVSSGTPPEGNAGTPSGTGSGPGPTPTALGGGVGQLAFASERNGLPQVFLMNVDGTGLTQVTNFADGACQPAWAPDGQRLVVTSPCRRNQQAYEGSGLWIVYLDGSAIEPLPTAAGGGDFDPAWSPDGRRIAFTSLRDGRGQIYLLTLETGEVVNLTGSSGTFSQPAWSPAGTHLLFTATRAGQDEIWVSPDFGGTMERFSRGPDEVSHADWAADGSLVLFQRKIAGIPRLFAIGFEDRSTLGRQVCPTGQLATQPMAEARWSPDGRWIAVETWPSGANHDIAIITTSCSNYTELTTDPANDFDAAWRP